MKLLSSFSILQLVAARFELGSSTGSSSAKVDEGGLDWLRSRASSSSLPSKKRSNLMRFLWQNPLCRDIEKCACGGKIGGKRELEGTITVGNEGDVDARYDRRQACMWHIQVPDTYTIHMQFDREYGFDVEYHNFCGFDKVHILKGHFGAGKNFEKIARFCGPRKNFEPLPWDGKRRIFHTAGDMDFWDIPFDVKDNKATVAWDADQTKVHKGWKLKWWAVENESAESDRLEDNDTFDTLAGVLHLLTGKIRPLIQAQITLPPRVKQNQLQHLNNLLAKLEEAISIKGPGTPKSCSDMEDWQPPSLKLKQILAEDHSLEGWLATDGPIVQYAAHYIGQCKNYKWDERVKNVYNKTLKNLGRARKPKF
jgi:hypothetical protein